MANNTISTTLERITVAFYSIQSTEVPDQYPIIVGGPINGTVHQDDVSGDLANRTFAQIFTGGEPLQEETPFAWRGEKFLGWDFRCDMSNVSKTLTHRELARMWSYPVTPRTISPIYTRGVTIRNASGDTKVQLMRGSQRASVAIGDDLWKDWNKTGTNRWDVRAGMYITLDPGTPTESSNHVFSHWVLHRDNVGNRDVPGLNNQAVYERIHTMKLDHSITATAHWT